VLEGWVIGLEGKMKMCCLKEVDTVSVDVVVVVVVVSACCCCCFPLPLVPIVYRL
jgi:hypothetical protein